jgi:hypothetical protein
LVLKEKTLDSKSIDRKADNKGCKQARFETFNKFTNACSASNTRFENARESLEKASLGTSRRPRRRFYLSPQEELKMNAQKLLSTAAAAVAIIGCSFAAAPANANDFERRLNFQAMQNYMNQRSGYNNQYYGNVNNAWRNNRCNSNWNNNWNNGWSNGRNWNNGRHNGWGRKWHHGRGHHH